MKVYIITNEPFPYGMAAAKRIYCYAKGMQALSIECEVITVFRTEKKSNLLGNVKAKGLFEGVSYRYIANSTYRNANLIIRKINDAIDFLHLLWFCRTKIRRKDIVLHYSESISLQMGALVASCFSGGVHIRELCEYPFVTQKNTLTIRLKKWMMLHLVFPFFDAFIVISQALYEVAATYKEKKAKILKVPILIDTVNEKQIEAFQSTIPYVFHAGTLYESKDGIESTLKAFAMAIQGLSAPLHFYIASDDANLKALNQCINNLGIQDNVIFLGKLTQKEVIPYWKGASLAILNKNDNLQNRYGFSTKLGEILVSETAVITTTIGEANHYLKDGESAYIISPHRPELIAEKIIQAFTNEEERQQIAKKGKEIAEKEFDCIYQGKRIETFIEQL